MLTSYFLYATLNHSADINNFIAVGFVGLMLMALGFALPPEKLQKLSTKLCTVNVFAALVTIVIANAMGWVSIEEVSGEIIGKIDRFWN